MDFAPLHIRHRFRGATVSGRPDTGAGGPDRGDSGHGRRVLTQRSRLALRRWLR